jgi:argininosuccinate lyase
LADLQLEQLKHFSLAFDQDFYSSITLEAVLACHDVPGGTNPARVRAAVEDLNQRVRALQEALHAHA